MDLRTLGHGSLPLLAGAVVICLVAVAYAHAAYTPATAGHLLDGCLEELLPLFCGFTASTLLAGDQALELQASARRALARLALVRLGALLLLTLASGGVVYIAGVAGLGVIVPRSAPGELVLTVLAPALLLAALAFGASIAMRAAPPASTLILALVAAENIAPGSLSSGPLRWVFLFATTYTPHEPGWLVNRLVLLLGALALLALGAIAASRPGTALALAHGDSP